jgi:hypothetical protein
MTVILYTRINSAIRCCDKVTGVSIVCVDVVDLGLLLVRKGVQECLDLLF